MSSEISTLLNCAYFYLRFRPRTEREMMEYLGKKAKKFKFTDESVESAIQRLRELKLVNDSDFISWYIEIRGSSKKKSKVLLKNELRLKGVSGNLIAAYFEEYEIDEDKGAFKALISQWRRFEHLDKKKRFEKAATFLQRRGFSYSVIKRAIAELEGKE